MHVRVTYVQIHTDKVDEATRLHQDSVVPAAQQQIAKFAPMLTAQPSRETYEVSVQV